MHAVIPSHFPFVLSLRNSTYKHLFRNLPTNCLPQVPLVGNFLKTAIWVPERHKKGGKRGTPHFFGPVGWIFLVFTLFVGILGIFEKCHHIDMTPPSLGYTAGSAHPEGP